MIQWPTVGFVFVIGGLGAAALYVITSKEDITLEQAVARLNESGPAGWLPAFPWEGPPLPRALVKGKKTARKEL